jgi:hypothetical protein
MIKKHFLLLAVLLAVNISFAQTRREIVDACFRDICIEISAENLLKNNKIVLPKEISTFKQLMSFLNETYPDDKNPIKQCCFNLNFKSVKYTNEELPKYWNDAVTNYAVGVSYDNLKIQGIIAQYEKLLTSAKEPIPQTIVANNTQQKTEIDKNNSKTLQSQIDELKIKLETAETEIKLLQKENKELKTEATKNTERNPLSVPIKYIFLLLTALLFVLAFIKKDYIMKTVKKLRKGKPIQSPVKNSPTISLNKVDKEESQIPELLQKKVEEKKFLFPHIIEKQWLIVKGKSIGKSHISKNQPCQDNHHSEQLNKTWGIAVNCDGMGSGDISQIGSEKVSLNLVKFFKERISNEDWFTKNTLPSNDEWTKIATETLKGMKAALSKYAISKKYDFQELATTVIVVVYSPHGLLIAHIGDGRAGYCNDKEEWNSGMIPHKGEEANETTFITSNWDAEPLTSSGVSVPECRVIDEPIRAFTLMSDGCEQHFFETKIQDPNSQSKKLIEINRPYANTMNGLVTTFYEMLKDKIGDDEINNHFNNYVKEGTTRIKNEPDDKSIIIGIFH